MEIHLIIDRKRMRTGSTEISKGENYRHSLISIT